MEDNTHWSEEKEVIQTNKSLRFLLFLMKHTHFGVVHFFCLPVAFFFWIFAKKQREAVIEYQKTLREYTDGKVPSRISGYKQILSFCLCVVEKMEGWLNKFNYEKLIKHDDDLNTILEQLNRGEGAFVIGSHLGNMELLRSISNLNTAGSTRHVEVTAIMEMDGTQQFNDFLKSMNPNVKMNLIPSSSIGPETMDYLEEQINNGGLVFIAADRTSAKSRDRVIVRKFLGKDAEFPYGVFVLASLLNVPTYYIFGLRDKTFSVNPKNHIYIEKSEIDFNCSRNERKERILALCDEFISKLEKYVKMYPYQWYNFYNYWIDFKDSDNK